MLITVGVEPQSATVCDKSTEAQLQKLLCSDLDPGTLDASPGSWHQEGIVTCMQIWGTCAEGWTTALNDDEQVQQL